MGHARKIGCWVGRTRKLQVGPLSAFWDHRVHFVAAILLYCGRVCVDEPVEYWVISQYARNDFQTNFIQGRLYSGYIINTSDGPTWDNHAN